MAARRFALVLAVTAASGFTGCSGTILDSGTGAGAGASSGGSGGSGSGPGVGIGTGAGGTVGGPGGSGSPGTTGGTAGSSAPAPLPPGAPVTGPLASAPGPSSRFVRLSHRQWENTVRDLLRLGAPGLAKDFLSEPIRSSFDNNGSILQVSGALWQDYQKAAETLGAQMARSTSAWTPFLGGAPATAASARAFVQAFGLRAFRRPLTTAELDGFVALFNQGPALVGSGNAFADGVEVTVSAFLQAPHFLYRSELGSNAANGRVALSGYEVAARLSYGLVNSMPDEMLLAAAGRNELGTRDRVLPHARRLLESEAGKATLEDLHRQLLKLTSYDEITKNTSETPLWRPGLGADMKQETLSFIGDVVFGQDKGLNELLTAPYSFVNSRLAPLYGLPARTVAAGQPDPFVRTALDGSQRAGLYTQLGFLAANATDATPRSIMRGVHVSLDALCVELPAPPNVPPETPADVGKTNRQLLEAFTEADGSVCQGCHKNLINPLGFAFEHFDAIGRHRTTDNGQPVNAAGRYLFDEGQRSFANAAELMQVVATSRQAHDCYAKHLFEYLYGRERNKDNAADTALIGEMGRRSLADQPVKALVLDLVSTDAFLTRLP